MLSHHPKKFAHNKGTLLRVIVLIHSVQMILYIYCLSNEDESLAILYTSLELHYIYTHNTCDEQVFKNGELELSFLAIYSSLFIKMQSGDLVKPYGSRIRMLLQTCDSQVFIRNAAELFIILKHSLTFCNSQVY